MELDVPDLLNRVVIQPQAKGISLIHQGIQKRLDLFVTLSRALTILLVKPDRHIG